MLPAGTFQDLAAPADATSAAPLNGCKQSAPLTPIAIRDTLHCSSDAAVSAAQFNQSVSAMPCYGSCQIDALRQGTADTLSKGWISRGF